MKANSTTTQPTTHTSFSFSEDELIEILKREARVAGHEVPVGRVSLSGLDRDHSGMALPSELKLIINT